MCNTTLNLLATLIIPFVMPQVARLETYLDQCMRQCLMKLHELSSSRDLRTSPLSYGCAALGKSRAVDLPIGWNKPCCIDRLPSLWTE